MSDFNNFVLRRGDVNSTSLPSSQDLLYSKKSKIKGNTVLSIFHLIYQLKDKMDVIWFHKCEEDVVEGLLDEEFRDELNREFGWKIYDVESINLLNSKSCRFEGKCIEGGVIVSKNGLSKEEILREF